MNRKQRRAAARRNKRHAADTKASATPDKEVEHLLISAVHSHRAGHLPEADTLYRKILAMDPNHIGSLHNLGLILHGSGRYQEALDLLQKAIELSVHNAVAHNSIGTTLCAL